LKIAVFGLFVCYKISYNQLNTGKIETGSFICNLTAICFKIFQPVSTIHHQDLLQIYLAGRARLTTAEYLPAMLLKRLASNGLETLQAQRTTALL